MAFATTVKLGAGTRLYFENPAEPGVYKHLANALRIGQLGTQGEFVETTPISAEVREYIGGLKTPPTKQITFNHVPGNGNYQEFLGLVDNDETLNMRADYKSGDRGDFVLVTSGRIMEDPEGNTQLQQIVFGQQSGDVSWSEV
ncbi:hypothetical protein FKG94_03110 [Exilibacterium tricleocarpae]|uniref:Phage tail protein n=1 Tax=Exilibacterium tricleocarpae TaxID=2591008 RepID=A0A545U725_9GAMM|nr:hypothetical protein [Exilibacterium tricleocarpae]TQV85193.1 hypothetical protein FKG94_03110 [Exilibacterium tricleocarpae]